ncbi:MAG: tRNA (N6-isopentenyl adenosine(37)-C2)-methylthiotransferase MiaB [Oscillospiraceae bacterium]|jgi:tRNA-2-methylthio-N6-dimethylallyladenosine synthase|nr:tRNA (N6-isopentenyl adenosine(37)-C2)-methylthiotransferase MiaB [Oscillospiraceae bacterium]
MDVPIKTNINKKIKYLAFIKTYGCQQNVSDSEKIENVLSAMGYQITNVKEEADFIIFNSCAVRKNAELRVFGNVSQLRKLKKKKPNIVIAICGCMTQQSHIVKKIRKDFEFVDIIFGTNTIEILPKLIKSVFLKRDIKNKKFAQNFKDINFKPFEILQKTDISIENLPCKKENKIKTFISIMHGCNNFCSYCIVPYVRGRELSRKSESLLQEFEKLVKTGCKEITLLGQNVNSYGKTLDKKISFTELLRLLTKIEGDFRIRFMTSHPKDVSKELIDEIVSNKKICKHIHLPVQSGSNKILEKMNRKYTREKYLKIIDYTRKKAPELSFTSDIIVGFPSETYQDFEETLSLVKEAKFSSLFTFIYSKRKGTLAADMRDNVPYQTKIQWLNELLKIQKNISSNFYQKFLGKRVRVLLEKEKNKKNIAFGKNSENLTVYIEDCSEFLLGKFVQVKIISQNNRVLRGKILHKNS